MGSDVEKNRGRVPALTGCVLVVDDDPEILARVEAILRDMEVDEILTAGDGESALGLIERHRERLGLLICDWKLPGIDGLSVARRASEAVPGLPVMLFTSRPAAMLRAQTHDDMVANLTRYGSAAYLAKPFSPQMLRGKVLGLLGRRR
jgi:DNA-binding response OmpR family regulator